MRTASLGDGELKRLIGRSAERGLGNRKPSSPSFPSPKPLPMGSRTGILHREGRINAIVRVVGNLVIEHADPITATGRG